MKPRDLKESLGLAKAIDPKTIVSQTRNEQSVYGRTLSRKPLLTKTSITAHWRFAKEHSGAPKKKKKKHTF